MKASKFFVLCIALLCYTHTVKAQRSAYKGSSMAQFNVGFTGSGVFGSFYYGHNFSQTVKGMAGGGMIFGTEADIKYKGLFLDGFGAFSAYKSQSRGSVFNLNLLAGISFIGDFINEFETDQFNKQFSLNYGVLGGLEMEFLAFSQVAISLSGTQRYYIKEEFGHGRYQALAGIKYFF